MADSRRNGWPVWLGTGGRFGSEWVAGLRRNQWPIPIGIRKRKRRVALRAALEEIATQTKNSKARGFEASTILLNIALFLLIAERDI